MKSRAKPGFSFLNSALTDKRLDCGDGVRSLCTIRATGLGHIRATAAAYATKGCGSGANQIDRAEPAEQIFRDRCYCARLVIFAHADKQHHAGTDLLLAFVGKWLEITRRNAGHDLAKEIDTVHRFDGAAAI